MAYHDILRHEKAVELEEALKSLYGDNRKKALLDDLARVGVINDYMFDEDHIAVQFSRKTSFIWLRRYS